MTFLPDLVEEQVSNIDQAWKLLNSELPEFNKIFTHWQKWYTEIVKDVHMQEVITDALVISYARMALRNGSLSLSPRNYHNEGHVDDLLYRLIELSKLPASASIPDYGWSLLSLFMGSHDLRQSEDNNKLELIGDNEQASYQEVSRLLIQLDTKNVIRQEHKELLKLMIHGSTFGQGEDTTGNIYKGNLVKYILDNIEYFGALDKELAYIACDIDTANVAADLKDYAQSSINVYNEIQNISKKEISAQIFFGEQQEQYFFELQKFNSELGQLAFSKQKAKNAPKIKQISHEIQQLSIDKHNDEVMQYYLNFINSQA